MNCRHCGTPLSLTVLDLGTAPPSNAFLSAERLRGPELWYPLRLLACETCGLVQTEDFLGRETLFDAEYVYFSSWSSTWLEHARRYVEGMIPRLGLDAGSLVVEVAANDGYLLQFVRQAGIPCLGVEPTAGTAAAARAKGIPVIERFFGRELARDLVERGHRADLMVANNVLAHVPDINDFVAGFATLLKPAGVATFEFPHLLRMVEGSQFDTAYHEHYSYLSFTTARRVLAANGLAVFDVEELPTHGGSLRVFAQRADTGRWPETPAVGELLAREREAGVGTARFHEGFQERAERIRDELLLFLIEARRRGELVVGYGAAAKGNTLLNFAGVRRDLLAYVVDRSPAKQGKFLPGSRIPVVDERRLAIDRPRWILILPWNLREEIGRQLSAAREWGGEPVTVVPKLHRGWADVP